MTQYQVGVQVWCKSFGNDPAAGSPTATLLRLLLALVKFHWGCSEQAKIGGTDQTPEFLLTPLKLYHR